MLKTILVFLLLCTSNLIFSQDSPTAVDPIPISGLTNSEFDDVKLTVDESAGAQANPADNLADRESIADFINLFGAVDYGTDGAGSTTFGLSISTDGVGTGLFALDATASNGKGAEILLFDTAGFIEGRTNTSSGDLYFTISNTGSEIILNQSANFNIWHPENTNHNDIVSLNGISGGSTSVTYSINLVQIITDADGDSDSAVLNLTEANTSAGSTEYVFNFLDDGPTAVAPTSISDASGIEFEGAKLTVDESADSQNSDRLILRELVSTYTVVAVFTASDTYDDAPVNYAIDPNSINASYFAINQCGFVTLTGSGLAEIEANPALDSLIVNVIITYGEGGAQLPIHSEATIGIKSTHIVEQLEIDLNNLIEEVNSIVAGEVVTPFPGGTTTTNATITSGVYSQTAPATFGGNIIFDGEGDANSIFIFKTVGAIDTTAGTVFEFINGATANNILFVSDGAVTLGAGSDISGTFITTAGSITIGEGVNLEGRAFSIDGSINNYGNIYVPTYNVGDNADAKQSHADFNEFFSNVAVEGDGTTSSYGADGAGLALFSLKLNITNGNNADGSVGSGIYEGIENGSEILLFDDNGVIKGMVDNDVYFTVTNNGSKITLTETSFNIWYDDEIVSLKGLGGDSTVDIPITYDINLNQTIIDADGDSAISSLSLTDGGGIDNSEYVFSFKDDGPQFDLGYLSSLVLFSPVGAVSNISADNIIVGDVGHNIGALSGFDAADHTGNIIDNDSLITDDGTTEACQANIPTITVDESSLVTDVSESFTGVFNGDDGTNAVDDYALGVSSSGADSSLVDTATGNKVFLFLESVVVVGREGTDTTDAFTGQIVLNINVDASGTVELDQVRAIVHSDTANPDDSSSSMTANLITLAATVTYGDSSTANAVANIAGSFIFIDDIPVAAADTGSVGEGALLTVLAAGGVLANDASGADGWAAPDAGVVGVVAGSDANIDTDSPTTLNTSIAGTYGTLILQDDGSYTYQSTANVISGNEADTFVYTVKDGDGDLTSETLTISLSDVTGETENTTPTEQANEAGIEGGSAEGDSSNIISGELSLQSGWSVNSAQSGSTSLGDWSVAPDGAFEYTLTTATTDVDVVAETDIFTYDAQDANGNTVSNTVTITIIDDSPEAYNDNICTDSSMGNVATGNVVDGSLTAGGLADNYGADVAGQLISFEHDGTVYSATNYGAFHTITTADGGTFIFYFEDVGVNVAGNFEYTASTGTGAEVTEVFTYTLRDADGDAASANVEICVDHETLAIEDLFLSNLNYYPNPVVYSFQIKGLTRTNVELELVNILGQQLKTIPNYNGEAVSIQEFSAGIYFINLKSETGFVSIKIIKTE